MNEISNNITTLRDLISMTADEFSASHIFLGHGTDNALDEAVHLILHCLSIDFQSLEQQLDKSVTSSELEKVKVLVKQRIQTRKPLAYLINKAYFANLEFYVTEDVLVPRSPFAELIEDFFFPWVDHDNINDVLDLCTGSGCIGIASAFAFPNASVTLSDISDKAIRIAEKNTQNHQLSDRISIIQSDIFSNFSNQTFDLILSNPPYVSENEYTNLPEEYLNEPSIGLVSGKDGMDIVTKILAQASSFLTKNGIIILEVGASADLLMNRFPKVPFQWIEFENGGDGVFILNKQELEQYKEAFK